MIGAAEFAVCKPTAFIFYIARGGADRGPSRAARSAADTAKIAGAGIDVTEPEPLPADDPLWTAPNLIISPARSASSTSQLSLQRLAGRVIENLETVS